MTTLRETLIELNPWWRGEFHLTYKPRSILSQIERFRELPQTIALTGLRRVGKTTLLLKVVQDALLHGLEPRRAIYFSFDEHRESNIRLVLQEYEALLGQDFRSGPHLLLLDEIQKLVGWEDQLKGLYDAYGKTLKIFLSGSESLFIRRLSRETLAGRLFDFRVEPLSFPEYLDFRDIPREPRALHEREHRRVLSEYIRSMGFPELATVGDKLVVRKYVQENIVEKILYRDLPSVVPIRNISVLETLLHLLMEDPGQILLLPELSRELGVSRQTVATYLRYLEDSFLVRKLYNYSHSRRKMERALKRYYPTVLSVDLAFREGPEAQSKVLEWLAMMQTHSEFFWRDKYGHEVDLVLDPKSPVPVEVKYGKIGWEGLRAFYRRFGVSSGYVVTHEQERKVELEGLGEAQVVPAHVFFAKGDFPWSEELPLSPNRDLRTYEDC